jgi:hypothetical protein
MDPDHFPEKQGAWKFPAIPVFLFLCLMLLFPLLPHVFVLNGKDLDVCWLVRTDELIWQNRCLPPGDVFSFTHATRPWVLYQWGFELYLGGLYRLAGLGGVVWGTVLIIGLTYALLVGFVLRLEGLRRSWAIGLVALAMNINSFQWWARPNIVSILAYVVLLLLLESYRRSPGRQLWLLPLLFLWWANIHLGFVLGLAVLLLYGIFAWLAPGSFREGGSSKDCRLLLIFSLCLGASLLNPYGPSIFLYLWRLSQAGVMNAGILELQSPNFHYPRQFFVIIQLVLLIWLGDANYVGRRLFIALVALTLAMGLYSQRHLPFFVIAATLHLAQSLQTQAGSTSPNLLPMAQENRGWAWGVLGALIALGAVGFIHDRHPGFYDFRGDDVPHGAVAYLGKVPKGAFPHNVFVTDDLWSDYFLFKLFPRVMVFLDTRYDMYGEELIETHRSLCKGIFNNMSVLDPWQVDLLIVRKEGISLYPPAKPPWALVYEDKQALVYRRGQGTIK